jgi:hypothetical protein
VIEITARTDTKFQENDAGSGEIQQGEKPIPRILQKIHESGAMESVFYNPKSPAPLEGTMKQ